MNKIEYIMKRIKYNSKFQLICLALFMSFLMVGCEVDENQQVATLSNIVLQDEFDVDGVPNPRLWGYDNGDGSDQGIPGWGK